MDGYQRFCIYSCKWAKKFFKLQLVLVLYSCFLLQFIDSNLVIGGNYLPYLISYVRIHSHPRDIRNTQGIYLLATQFIAYSLGILLGGALDRKLGPRVVTIVGGLLACTGTAVSFYLIDISYYVVLVTYGFVHGFGVGMIFMPLWDVL